MMPGQDEQDADAGGFPLGRLTLTPNIRRTIALTLAPRCGGLDMAPYLAPEKREGQQQEGGWPTSPLLP